MNLLNFIEFFVNIILEKDMFWRYAMSGLCRRYMYFKATLRANPVIHVSCSQDICAWILLHYFINAPQANE